MTGVFEFIELYLIRDLQSIRSLESDDGLGKCGYQMMVSICTGCELLGSIEKNDFSNNSEAKFLFFIKKHLSHYVFSWKILYHFIRNRVAHDFITPPNVVIRLKNDKLRHLGTIDDWFVVDAYVFMDDFISTYRKIKEKYESDPDYKKLMDKGYQQLIEFMKDKSNKLNEIIAQSRPKELPYPDQHDDTDPRVAVPSGAMFEFDYLNFTRIPDDMLEKMNISLDSALKSGASGSSVDSKDIKPLKKDETT
ncbi:MAG: hypothetical protein ABIJ43_04860 [Candidatus Beckwithbacteria bacterium]